MKRKIIKIDLEKCTGCSLCIPNCPEGAIQMIDGKARLISDLFCDGLGACLGACPEEAIAIEEREAEPYSEKKVMENIIPQGANVIKAHLQHLQEHGENDLLQQAQEVLKENGVEIGLGGQESPCAHGQAPMTGGCPGSKIMDFSNKKNETLSNEQGKRQSQLGQWPIQMHLISPQAAYYKNKDVLLVADCVAYALGDFHKDYLKEKSIAIACPKLDSGTDIYIEKVAALIDQAEINTLTVMIMQVPCCRGLLQIAQEGTKKATRKVPVKLIVVGIKGEIVEEGWV